MSSIKTALDSLELSLSRHQSHYAAARGRLASLATFTTAKELVAALHQSSPLREAARYDAIAALLREHRTNPHPLWSALLILAFAPMLRQLRSRLGYPRDEDRDQRVLLAFVEAMATVRPDVYAAVALTRATKKAVFAGAKTEAAESAPTPFDDEQYSRHHPLADTLHECRAEAGLAARNVARLAGERAAARRKAQEAPAKLCTAA